MTPAREMDLRGPSLRRAQEGAMGAAEGAVGNVERRSELASAFEYGAAIENERQAQMRQATADQAAAEREEELARLSADFAASTKALGKMAIEPNRFWASQTTGQKILSFIGLALGGFTSGFGGGPNTALEALNAQVDRDIKAQEFAYNAQKDVTQGKQTAFALAMQKYNHVDAARAMSRAAAMDGIQAQIAQTAAMWKGTEAGNRADLALAEIEQAKMQQIAQGVRFLPSQLAPHYFTDPRYPGVRFSNKDAIEAIRTQEKYEQEREMQGLKTTGDILVAGTKKSGTEADRIGQETRFIAEKLQNAGVPQARAAADSALAALNKSPGGSGEAAYRAVAPGVLANKTLSDERNAREQAYWNFANQAMKALMGNVTADEFERAQKQLGSAGDPESRKRAVNSVLVTLSEVEKGIRAGVSKEAQDRYSSQRMSAEGQPPLTPSGAKADR